ncbi:MAG: hypothetical protein WCZ86_06120 [Desulfurivibrionaceae bacterium]
MKIPRPPKGPSRPRGPRVPALTEAGLQQRIRQYFSLMKAKTGWDVMSTSAFKAKGALGTTPGVPDLLAYSTSYPGILVGLEVKKPGKIVFSSPQQETFAMNGVYFVVQSEEDCFRALAEIQRRYPKPTDPRGIGNLPQDDTATPTLFDTEKESTKPIEGGGPAS